MIQYTSVDELVREVKNELSTHFERGSLDESFIYPPIKKCLSKMGVRILPTKSDIVNIENYNGDLPCAFYKLVFAVGCHKGEYKPEPDYLNTKLVEHEVSESDFINTCKTTCDVCSDSCNNLFEIKQYFNTYSVEFTNLYPLKVTTDARPYCTDECFKSLRKGNEITIKNGKIYTAFETGKIYLEYLTLLEEDGELLIPDNEIIKDWIKHEIFFVLFRKLYLNGEGDMVQRLQWMQQQLAISQVNAESLYKRFTVKEFYDLRKTLYSRFHKFNTAVYGKNYNNNISQHLTTPNHQDYNYTRFV